MQTSDAHVQRTLSLREKNHSITNTTSDLRLSYLFRPLSTSHCQCPFWLWSISPYCVTKPQCVNAWSCFWRNCSSLLQTGALWDMGMAHCWIYATGLLCVPSGFRPYGVIRPKWVTKIISIPYFQRKVCYRCLLEMIHHISLLSQNAIQTYFHLQARDKLRSISIHKT